jgi:hypothetical protein
VSNLLSQASELNLMNNGLEAGAIIGIVIATFFIVFIILFVIFKILELRKHNRRTGKTNRISLGIVLK